MGLIPEQENLTVIDPVFESVRRRTHPGMAHFAGTGPNMKTCRECLHWTGCGGERGYYAKKGIHGGGLKPRSCAVYQKLMQGFVGPGVPYDAGACKYFELTATPPLATDKH